LLKRPREGGKKAFFFVAGVEASPSTREKKEKRAGRLRFAFYKLGENEARKIIFAKKILRNF
jgi:hypothetical protein